MRAPSWGLDRLYNKLDVALADTNLSHTFLLRGVLTNARSTVEQSNRDLKLDDQYRGVILNDTITHFEQQADSARKLLEDIFNGGLGFQMFTDGDKASAETLYNIASHIFSEMRVSYI